MERLTVSWLLGAEVIIDLHEVFAGLL